MIRRYTEKMANSQTNKKNSSNFLIQGSILAAAGIIVRLIGLAYRIPLIRIIGDEGMGYYSVAFEVYSVILLLSSYSLPLAVSKMISARIAKEDYINAHRTLKMSLLYATIVGAAGCLFVACTADWFANVFYKLPLCKYALLTLAPTIWIMAYLGVVRGYFQGKSTMVPTAVSQILEQVVNAIVSVGAAWWLCNSALKAAKGESEAVAWGAAGGTIGTGAGALTALIVLIIMYFAGRKIWKSNVQLSVDTGIKEESYKELSKVFVLTVIPVILSTAVYNISGIIDAEMYSGTMAKFGMDASEVATQYGAFTGRYKTLINIPIAIANSLSSSLIPIMARAVAENDKKGVHDAITLALRFTVLIAMPASAGLTVLGGPIITLLFKESAIATQMTVAGSFAVLFYSVSTVSNAILQGNSYMRLPVIHSVISLGIHIIALRVMMSVFKMGVISVVLANMIFALSMCILNGVSIRQKTGYRQEWLQTYIKPAVCSVVMAAITYGVKLLVSRYVTQSNTIITFICLIVAVVVCAVMVLLTGCITREELKKFPIIKKFV